MPLRSRVSFLYRTYRYRVEMTGAHRGRQKLELLLKTVWQGLAKPNTILFYPEKPLEFHALFKILKYLGYHVTTNPDSGHDLVIKMWLAFDGNPFAPRVAEPALKNGKKAQTIRLNTDCNDISKNKVNAVFDEVFGYSLAVDPRRHQGPCVMKLNWNALHKGRIIECPVEHPEEGFVYQKLIHNETGDGFVEDMRVPIFAHITPFVYLKYRSVDHRFVDRKHTNTKATIAEVDEVLNEEEVRDIQRFAAKIGLDYGELDVLRDKSDGKIYIVDANNTPSGPPTPISAEECKIAVMRLAQAFDEAFVGGRGRTSHRSA
jgi:hypothetical protein